MHYRDGTEAKIGDIVKTVDASNTTSTRTTIGPLVSMQPGTDKCNGYIVPMISVAEQGGGRIATAPPAYQHIVTLGECDKVA